MKIAFDMLKMTALVIVFLISNTNLISADNYNVGDELFVWAKSGLHLRSSPSINSSIIKTLEFGASLRVIEKSDFTYNITIIQKAERGTYASKVDPINAFGNWVKVSAGTEVLGYLIDQYLLPVNPGLIFSEGPFINVELKTLSVDTTWRNPKDGILNENETKYCIKNYHPYFISTYQCVGGFEVSIFYEFPNFSIEEVLIFFSSSNENYKGFSVQKNWKEEVMLSDGIICEWRITHKNNITIVGIECSC